MANPFEPPRELVETEAEVDLDVDEAPVESGGGTPVGPPAPAIPVHRFPDERHHAAKRGSVHSELVLPETDIDLDQTPGPLLPPDLALASVAPEPPPLPRTAPDEILALPGSAADFELFAPAPIDEPEPGFSGTAGAWSDALSGLRKEPLARIVPIRPPPPVLPQVAVRAGVPPALPRVATFVPPEPTPAPPPMPGPEFPEPRDMVIADDFAFSPGPPSIADDLYAEIALNPRVDGEHQVVVHTREGQALRGSLRDVELSNSILPLETRGGTLRVAVDRIRAVFFMVPVGEPLPAPEGRRAKVVLEDGRPVTGYIADFRNDAIGFFLMPGDPRGRTARIFFYRDAVKSIQFVDGFA